MGIVLILLAFLVAVWGIPFLYTCFDALTCFVVLDDYIGYALTIFVTTYIHIHGVYLLLKRPRFTTNDNGLTLRALNNVLLCFM